MSVGKLRPACRLIAAVCAAICGMSVAIGDFGVRAADEKPAAKPTPKAAAAKPSKPAAQPAPKRATQQPAKRTAKEAPKRAAQRSRAPAKRPALPSVQQLQAAYRKNLAELFPLGLEYSVLRSEHEAAINADRHRLREKQVLAKMKRSDVKFNGQDVSEEYFAVLMRDAAEQIKYYDQVLQPEVVKKRLSERVTERQFLWTDGKAFHVRRPHDPTQEETLFPAEVSTENLPKHFEKIALASWSQANNPPLRCWFGTAAGGRVCTALNNCFSMTSFAPLGFVRGDWTHSWDWHELDQFMAADPAQLKVVKRVAVRKRTMYLVEGILENPRQIGVREHVRAWIDPARGCLPLRIEWRYVDANDKEAANLHRDLQLLDVKQGGGNFYPTKIRRRDFIPDEMAIEKQRQELAAGKSSQEAPAPPMVPGVTTVWQITKIIPHKAVDEATLALEFPTGTLYANAVDQKMYRAGDAEPLPPPPEPIYPGQAAPPLKVASWTDGKSHGQENFGDKVVVLIFSESPGDLNEITENKAAIAVMKRLQAQYSAQGAVFVEIFTADTDMAQVHAFHKARGYNTLAGVDEAAEFGAGATSRAYLGGAHTGLVIIGRDGKVTFNDDALEEEAGMQLFFESARALSLPWPLDENAPEEELVQQQVQIFEHLVGTQLNKALAAGK